MKASRPYEEGLYQDLKDPREAALYLNACIEDGDPDVILLALQDIAKSCNMSHVAERIKGSRTSLYKMLTKGGNPSFRTVLKVLDAIGLGLQFVPAKTHGRRTRHAVAA